MDYDSSKCGEIVQADRPNDKLGSASESISPKGYKKPASARNWAWANGHEVYDWMDSHSLPSARDTSD